jgi:hypothetical protein
MASPSGGIPKHLRILGILEIFHRTSPLDFQALASRFSALESVDLTEALKRALYRDIQELVAEGRLEELRHDASGDLIADSPDLEKIVAKSVWRLVTTTSERFLGESLLRENGIEISGSDFLVSEVYAQMDLEIRAEKFIHFVFGEHERLVVRIPRDLVPFTVFIGRSPSPNSLIDTRDVQKEAKPQRNITLTLPDASISRAHCKIEFNRWNNVVVFDLDSSNGTTAHILEKVSDGEGSRDTFTNDSNYQNEWSATSKKAPTLSLGAYLGRIAVTPASPLAIESRTHVTCGVCRFLLVP